MPKKSSKSKIKTEKEVLITKANWGPVKFDAVIPIEVVEVETLGFIRNIKAEIRMKYVGDFIEIEDDRRPRTLTIKPTDQTPEFKFTKMLLADAFEGTSNVHMQCFQVSPKTKMMTKKKKKKKS